MAPSTFALDYLNNVPISTGNTAPKVKQEPKTKQKFTVIPGTKEKNEATLSRKGFFGIGVCILFIMIMLVFSVFLSSKATSVKYNINHLTNENNRIENEIMLVNTKIEAENSINNISDYAFDVLGLGAATADQYSIINSNDIDENLVETIKSKVFNN